MSTFTSKYKSTPTFTFKGRNKSVTSLNDPSVLPPPNLYNPEKVSLRKSPSTRFPKSQRKAPAQMLYRNSLPGPGTHQPISYTTAGPKKTISRVLYKYQVSQTPSPFKYNADANFIKNKDPSFSMRQKTKSLHDIVAEKNLSKPGPGNYEQPILKYKSNLSITMAKSLRVSLVAKQKNPGPGSYQPEKSFNSLVLSQSKIKIGREKRTIDFALHQRSPGPGIYNSKSSFQLNKQKYKGYSCRSKILSPVNKNPGPGSYQTPMIHRYNSSPVIKMPKSSRFSFIDKSIKIFQKNPGPGSFDIKDTKFPSMNVHKFPKSNKNYLSQILKNQSSVTNAPGLHNTDNFYQRNKNSPKFSIGKSPNRMLLKNIPLSPGPGQYNPKTQLIFQSKVTHKIQRSKRSTIIKDLIDFPGPGQYAVPINQPRGLKFKFTKQKKKNYFETKISKQKSIINQTYQDRQQFPNPPKYMSVVTKLKYNQKKLTNT